MKFSFAAFLVASFASLLPAASKYAGRYDITLVTPQGNVADWLELVEKDGKLDGRFQPPGGAVRPLVSATETDGRLKVVLMPATANAGETVWDLTMEGDKLTGSALRGSETVAKVEGVRAPKLDRKTPKHWTKPEALFNGKDLSGWVPVKNPQNSHWVVKDGELLNEARGSNLRTERTFQDFQLHIEVNCPEHCNSGIYLRGRYEIQVGTEGGKLPNHEMGAIYGYFAPAKEMPMNPGQWQVFDITLVGRTVTVKRNGITIHDKVEMPGITGGALDSNESEPGPFFLQGDHDGGMRYRNITVATPKS